MACVNLKRMARNRLHLSIVVAVAVGLCCRGQLYAEVSPAQEYQVKAAFIYNFAKFVEWPPGVFSDPRTPLVLCIVGVDPFGMALDTLNEKTVKDRKLVIHKSTQMGDLAACHMAFISASEKERLARLLDGLTRAHVLTISDIESFLQVGGIINLITVDNKIGFEINIDAAQRAGLTISSQLLRLATAVRGKRS
jgi:YfiR/HmsC-like